MSLCYKSYFYGTPDNVLPQLEAVYQGTLDALLSAAMKIADKQKSGEQTWYNDVDYAITCTQSKVGWQKLPGMLMCLEDVSAGWWAALQWADDGTIFNLHTQSGKLPKKLPTWKKLEEVMLYGKTNFHFQASRSKDEDDSGWYCPLNRVDLQHPLLLHLNNAIEYGPHDSKG